jgi:hypothetical protein
MMWHFIFTLLTVLVGFKNKIKLETASSIFLFWWSIHAMEESNQRDTHFLFFRFNGGLSHFLVLCFVCLFVCFPCYFSFGCYFFFIHFLFYYFGSIKFFLSFCLRFEIITRTENLGLRNGGWGNRFQIR